MRFVRLLILSFTVISAVACKPRHAALNEISLTKKEVKVEIPEGVVYIELKGPQSDANYPAPIPAVLIGDDEGFELTESTSSAQPSVKSFAAMIAAETKIANGDKSGVEPYTSKTPTLNKIRSAVQNQMLFVMGSLKNSTAGMLTGDKLGFSANNFKLNKLDVPLDQVPLVIKRLNNEVDAKTFVAVKYSLTTRGVIPNEIKLEKPIRTVAYAPLANDSYFVSEALNKFRSCCVKTPDDGGAVTSYNFFYYLDTEKAEFKTINAGDRYFKETALTVSPITSGKADAAPEYDRIWEDDRLVATYVFGDYGSVKEGQLIDPGQKAYFDFLNDVRRLGSITIEKEEAVSKTNVRFRGTVKNTGWSIPFFAKTKYVDIQVIQVENIANITPELGKLIFGDRIGPSDLFMYNGHSGYGNNVKHIESLIEPNPSQYVLFYLNGCYTYQYAGVGNPNFDVMSNGKMTYFTDMTQASIATLDGLLKGSTYRQILSKIPQRGCPTVSGEDIPSVKP